MLKKIYIAIFAIVAASCTAEKIVDDPNNPEIAEEKVRIQLITEVPEFAQPISKTGLADENTVGNQPWVFVFRGTNDNATFFEVKQAIVIGGKSYVSLTKTTQASMIAVLANPPAQFAMRSDGQTYSFTEANLNTALAGKTLLQVVNTFVTYPSLGMPQRSVPYTSPAKPIPMSAIMPVLNTGITNSTYINASGAVGGQPLKLNRIVAKIVAQSTVPTSTFEFFGMTVAGVPTAGALLSSGTTMMSNTGFITNYEGTAPNEVEGIAYALSGSTAMNPIYVYEISDTNSPSVIIFGNYQGKPCYYRLAFAFTNLNPIMLVRNKYYTFNITSVGQAGYDTYQEALTGAFSNVKYTISITDVNSYDIVANSQYMLAVSNSALDIFEQPIAMNSVLAAVASTDAPMSTSMRDITVSGVGLSLTTPNQKMNVGVGITPTNIYVNLAAGFTTGSVTLRIGNLIKIITITMRSSISKPGMNLYSVANVNYAEVTGGSSWISVADQLDPNNKNSRVTLFQGVGQVITYVSANATGAARNDGEVIYGRANNLGRQKIIFHQLAN